MVEPVVGVKAVKDDPNDDHVVGCAIAADTAAIITGDKDLLRIVEYQGIKMLRLGAFLRRSQGTG
jgi:predicted nucleic acid-binding protein